jgi:hypothetical protein
MNKRPKKVTLSPLGNKGPPQTARNFSPTHKGHGDYEKYNNLLISQNYNGKEDKTHFKAAIAVFMKSGGVLKNENDGIYSKVFGDRLLEKQKTPKIGFRSNSTFGFSEGFYRTG